MAELTLPLLGGDTVTGGALKPAVGRVQDIASRSEAFSQALNRQAQGIDGVVASGVTPPVNGTEASSAAEDQIRARRALELDSASRASPASTAGDTILGGMQKIRGIFDVREHSISRVQQSNLVDTQTLIEMQKEVVQYTMLLDITSKLSGKASQVVDQLMKGQ